MVDINVPDDKVIIFRVKPQSKYKEKIIEARFELTGKYTNMILTDENGVVIEALHHIDSSKSYREVKPLVKLKELPPFKSKFDGEVEDVEKLLEENYQKVYSEQLKRAKQQKINIIEKKIRKIEEALSHLQEPKELEEEAKEATNFANIILANLHQIKPYDRVLETYDFEGNSVKIPLPDGVVKNRVSEYYFKKARKALNRAKNIEIEKRNLQERLNFMTIS